MPIKKTYLDQFLKCVDDITVDTYNNLYDESKADLLEMTLAKMGKDELINYILKQALKIKALEELLNAN